jgi:hypothetical protein
MLPPADGSHSNWPGEEAPLAGSIYKPFIFAMEDFFSLSSLRRELSLLKNGI